MSFVLGLFTGLFIAIIIGLLINLYNEAEIRKLELEALEDEEIEIL